MYRIVIPARYGSSRLPGKPLADIAGRPMVLRVLDRALEAGAESVVVATDDDRVRAAVEAAGHRALMTSPDHQSGTERLVEVVETLGWPDETLVVNVQGDEPLIDPVLIRDAARQLLLRADAVMATLAHRCRTNWARCVTSACTPIARASSAPLRGLPPRRWNGTKCSNSCGCCGMATAAAWRSRPLPRRPAWTRPTIWRGFARGSGLRSSCLNRRIKFFDCCRIAPWLRLTEFFQS